MLDSAGRIAPRVSQSTARTSVRNCASLRYPLDMSEPSKPNERSAPDETSPPSEVDDAGETASQEREGHERPQGMVPGRERRRSVIERGFVRIIATGGIIGVATILGAVLVSEDVGGWIVGAAVGLTSVTLAALLWSSRQL